MANYILLSMDHPVVRQLFASGGITTSATRTRSRRVGAKGAGIVTNLGAVAATPRKRRRRARRVQQTQQLT